MKIYHLLLCTLSVQALTMFSNHRKKKRNMSPRCSWDVIQLPIRYSSPICFETARQHGNPWCYCCHFESVWTAKFSRHQMTPHEQYGGFFFFSGVRFTFEYMATLGNNLVDKSENHTGKDQVFLSFRYNNFFFTLKVCCCLSVCCFTSHMFPAVSLGTELSCWPVMAYIRSYAIHQLIYRGHLRGVAWVHADIAHPSRRGAPQGCLTIN